ncbi:hypothetical protein E4U40_006731 [Claviceps sp. LM458 group G5]|nr:hypothetical protein E4U40_006731 [Claviceps sp. LM458 group G5]
MPRTVADVLANVENGPDHRDAALQMQDVVEARRYFTNAIAKQQHSVIQPSYFGSRDSPR